MRVRQSLITADVAFTSFFLPEHIFYVPGSSVTERQAFPQDVLRGSWSILRTQTAKLIRWYIGRWSILLICGDGLCTKQAHCHGRTAT